MEWNVPDHGKRTCMASSPTMRLARRVISTAARREKVRSRMRCGFAPRSTRCATRCASVLVLPVPAPARISSAPSPWHAAARCAAFSFLNLSVTSTEGDYRLLLYILPVTRPAFRGGMRKGSATLAFPMSLEQRLRALKPDVLKGMRRGIEKESLRVRPDGTLSQAPHARALGSALTHAHITTDFSESQLELITGVHGTVESCLEELQHIHQVVYRALGDEVLWCASMPCHLPADHQIPIGRYGTSNVGRAKTVYRIGLAHRYGRRMQAISGIHYNFSVPGATNEQYFALIRNFRRHSWLLLYLFGASPAVCSSFVAGRKHELVELANGKGITSGTHYGPHATSLRMGNLGYQSDAQASLRVSYNDLDQYTASLYDALTQPYAPYEQIGVRTGDDYRQLSTTLLQIENEFYSTIRPKRRIRRGERP